VTAVSARVDEFLNVWDTMSETERHHLARQPEFACLMARLKWGDDEPVPFEQLDLALELAVRYPHPLGYYRDRSEDPGRRRLTERLAASIPFSAGTRD
jgi:hypothetical protein